MAKKHDLIVIGQILRLLVQDVTIYMPLKLYSSLVDLLEALPIGGLSWSELMRRRAQFVHEFSNLDVPIVKPVVQLLVFRKHFACNDEKRVDSCGFHREFYGKC
jgi:hypothetical protein